MDSNINYEILDGNNLSKTVDGKLVLLKEDGFSDETNTNLKTALADLEAKETAQNTAAKKAQNKTAEQDKIITGVYSLVKRTRNSVRSAYEDDQAMLSQFRVNEPIPNSVKNLRSLCEYLNPLVIKESAVLLKNGLMQNDIDELGTASSRILAVDSEQEQAKKLQQSATILRNNAAKELTKQIKKVRTFVKARFEKRPEISVLFDPIPKGRGGSGSGDEPTPPDNTTPPTTPAQ